MRINLNYKNLKTLRVPSRRKVFFILLSFVLSGLLYYYWQNRYVELHPVLPNGYDRQIVFTHNQLFKIAEPNEVSPDYYKNIQYVLDRSGVDYIIRDKKIYVKYLVMNDMEMIWNYTTQTTNADWFKRELEMDSINRIYKKQYEDSIRKLKL